MVDTVKRVGVHPSPPPPPAWAYFSIMMEWTPESSHCHSGCTLWTEPVLFSLSHQWLAMYERDKIYSEQKHAFILIHSEKETEIYLSSVNPYSRRVGSVELFLQSSELGLPHPLTCRRLCPLPPCFRGGGAHALACGRRGGGVPIPTRGYIQYCGTLYICVLCAYSLIPPCRNDKRIRQECR